VIHTLNVVVIAMLGRIEHHPGMLPTLRIYLNHLRRGPTQLRREAGQAYFGAGDRPKRGEKRQRLIFPIRARAAFLCLIAICFWLVSTAQRITGYRGCLACTDEQDPDMGKRR
jgi:hypothetical protein